MYGADCLRKFAVGDSGAGSGLDREASCWALDSEDSGMVEDVGTGAAVAYCLKDGPCCRAMLGALALVSRRMKTARDMLGMFNLCLRD